MRHKKNHICSLIIFGTSRSIPVHHLRYAIKSHKLEIGFYGSLIFNNHISLSKCVTSSFITHMWKFMWEKNPLLHNITYVAINTACNLIEAIKNALDRDMDLSLQSKQFDVISAIDYKLKISPLRWSWIHVKGIQYYLIVHLYIWETINVERYLSAK